MYQDESAETEASATSREVDITIPEGSQPGDVLSIEVNGKMLEVTGTLETLRHSILGSLQDFGCAFLLRPFHFLCQKAP